jgi:hypothetical protein
MKKEDPLRFAGSLSDDEVTRKGGSKGPSSREGASRDPRKARFCWFHLDKAGKVGSRAAPHVTLELLQSLHFLASAQRPLTRCLLESVAHGSSRSGRCELHGHQVPEPLSGLFDLRRPCQ